MAQPTLHACQYVVIAIAPDPLRGEHVNIGVALFHPSSGGFAGVRLNPDFRRVRQLSPGFDPSDLAGLEADLTASFAAPASASPSREYLIELARETFSHTLRFSASAAVLTDDPAAELDRLYRAYAAPAEPVRHLGTGVRSQILRHLNRVFTEERVFAHLDRRVTLGDRCGLRDRFRFDYYYRAAGEHSVVQALALDAKADPGPVKELCFTVQWIRARVDGLDAVAFTPDATPGDDDSRALLASAGIRALTLSQAAEESARIKARLGL